MLSSYNQRKNTNSRRYCEDAPPSKKLVSDGDILITNLVRKQLETKTSIEETVFNEKIFENKSDYTPLTNHVKGYNTLGEFRALSSNLEEIEEYKSFGLSTDDIDLYKSHCLGHDLKQKYKNVNDDVLKNRICRILDLLKAGRSKDCLEPLKHQKRHQTEFGLAVKPNSAETKLLNFALSNENQKQELPHPLDDIQRIEQTLMEDLCYFNRKDVKNIRKKARSIGNKINNLAQSQNISESVKPPWFSYSSCDKISKWDIIEKNYTPPKTAKVIKSYTCATPNYYSIKDGRIVKLDNLPSDDSTTQHHKDSELKSNLSIEEIKQIPKFQNYTPGNPSKYLYIKNLAKTVCENDLKQLLNDVGSTKAIVRVLKGKMHGQAFIKFESMEAAANALNRMNGVLLKNKPLIVCFRKND